MEYCVQFGESSFNCLSRLMARFGVWYYFDHDPNTQTNTLNLRRLNSDMTFKDCKINDPKGTITDKDINVSRLALRNTHEPPAGLHGAIWRGCSRLPGRRRQSGGRRRPHQSGLARWRLCPAGPLDIHRLVYIPEGDEALRQGDGLGRPVVMRKPEAPTEPPNGWVLPDDLAAASAADAGCGSTFVYNPADWPRGGDSSLAIERSRAVDAAAPGDFERRRQGRSL